eukprot:13460527-Alexandrium_andersonii.AAC.1
MRGRKLLRSGSRRGSGNRPPLQVESARMPRGRVAAARSETAPEVPTATRPTMTEVAVSRVGGAQRRDASYDERGAAASQRAGAQCRSPAKRQGLPGPASEAAS